MTLRSMSWPNCRARERESCGDLGAIFGSPERSRLWVHALPAELGFAPVASAPVIENREVLPSDFSGQRRNRQYVDFGRYAPQRFGVRHRLCENMRSAAKAMTLEFQGHGQNEIGHQHRHL